MLAFGTGSKSKAAESRVESRKDKEKLISKALELQDGNKQRYDGQRGSEGAGEHKLRSWSQDYGTRLKGPGKIDRLLI
jgi:hypothetical protein